MKRDSKPLSKADRAFLRRSDDRGIDYSDIPPIPAAVLRRARMVRPPRKVRITTHLDADVLAWLRRGGPRYQTRINAILRAVMLADPGAEATRRRQVT